MTSLPTLPAHALTARLLAGDVSATEVAEAALERTRALDPELGSFNTLMADAALAKAKDIDARIAAGKPVGPLAGVPLAIKDNMCTRGVPTTCSSKILEDFVPPYNATVVELLDRADAVPIGKTNLDEFAMGSSTENSGFRPTRNPWDLSRAPGGSSGGSAAAVASAEAVIATGSDTGGSIRQPAAFCGVVGLKPTYGRVSRYGLVAFASSLDQIGTFTRDVRDAAIALGVIAGHDPRDSTSANVPVPDYVASLDDGVKGVRIGVPREYFAEGIEPSVEAAVRAAADVYRSLGAELVNISLPHTEYAVAIYYIVATAEASSNLARYDGVHYGHRAPDQKDMIEMYAASREEGFGPEVKRRVILGTYALSSGYYDAYYIKASKVRSLIKADFDQAFESVDAIACPTAPTAAFRIGEKTDDPLQMYMGDVFTLSCNLAGIPGLAVPCGLTGSGLPIGLQLLGKPFDELGLLQLAKAHERTTEWHTRRPTL